MEPSMPNEPQSEGAPSGTITLLFTDIEGSTKLWEAHPDKMHRALARHDELVRLAVARHNGHVFKTIGDAFCAAFQDAESAVRAAVASQISLQGEPWDEDVVLRVRMALHTGLVDSRDGEYFGPTLNRVARLLDIAYGGQILLPKLTAELCSGNEGCEFRSLGDHQLMDLARRETIFQVVHPQLTDEFPNLRSLGNRPNNLPEQVTSFIGREREIADIKSLLGKTRLLTVTGSGGCGKTRLTLQVAAELLEENEDGAWLVELGPITDPDLVPRTVANALQVREERGRPILQSVVEFLKNRQLLLLIDNCEHLLDACARVADEIIRHCPRVRVLASSREGLGISGESSYRVPSLGLPDANKLGGWEAISDCEAVRLFVARASQIQTGFRASEDNAQLLAGICRRLDGIPLAIELAAARVRSLSLEELNQRLDQRFRLLTGGSRTALPRQQTLRATIDWSYDLLRSEEKALLGRLSVFGGGWSLDAAERVCAGEGLEEADILDLLTHLVDKSLVFVDERAGVVRYRLLETVRQYALDRLLESGHSEIWRNRHLAVFLDLVLSTRGRVQTKEQAIMLDLLENEHDNIRAALAWACEGPENIDSAVQIARHTLHLWVIRNYYAEGKAWAELILSRYPDRQAKPERTHLLNNAAILWWDSGELNRASEILAEALSLGRECDERSAISAALVNSAALAKDQGDYAKALPLFDESVEVARQNGNSFSLAMALSNVAVVNFDCCNFEKCRAFYEESLGLFEQQGEPFNTSRAMCGLANLYTLEGKFDESLALFTKAFTVMENQDDPRGHGTLKLLYGNLWKASGDLEQAMRWYLEALSTFHQIGFKRHVAPCFEELAEVEYLSGNPGRAAKLWGYAEQLRREMGTPRTPYEGQRYGGAERRAREAFGGDAEFEAAWQSGRAMPENDAVALALGT
jgi:predicted ATPase/class 3 adenylate cyclase